MTNEEKILEINEKINILSEKLHKKNESFDFVKSTSFGEWERNQEPEVSEIAILSREKRMIMPYVLSEIPEYGHVMGLMHFIENVKDGGFIDYDGSGNYVKDGKTTDITINPSDVQYDSIRYEFDTIVWYNR